MGLPPAFIKHLEEQHQLSGEEIDHFSIPPDFPSIRFNPKKSKANADNSIPWAQWGKQLTTKPIFHHDPKWHGGMYYVQNKSSMLIEPALKLWKSQIGSTEKVLDLCAAPGGKSTHLLSLIDDTDLLVANEMHPKRALILKDNLERWGHTNAVVINHRPKDIQGSGIFDFIVVDAPCSGEGLFSEFPKAIDQWSESYVEECSLRQKDILRDSDRLLANNGGLLYCTCTVNHLENREVVEDLVTNHGYAVVEIPALSTLGVTKVFNHLGDLRGYQALPHKIGSRAFFLCLLQKSKETKTIIPKVKRPFFKRLKGASPALDWVDLNTDHAIISADNGYQYIVRSSHLDWLLSFSNAHKILSLGTQVLGTNIKVPYHGLALAADLGLKMDSHECTEEDALNFLTGQSLPTLGLPGWKVLRFQDISLGFAKTVSGRSNNYFPKVWRIPGSTTLEHLKGFQLK